MNVAGETVKRKRRGVVPGVAGVMCWSALSMAGGGCGDDAAQSYYQAEIRWTENKIPHITATDLPSVFFGQGYAFASLGGCVLADQIVKVRSERAMFFGPGPGNSNINSDVALLATGLRDKANTEYALQSEQVRQAIDGYVAGFNQYLATRRARLPCAAETWLRPISSEDLFAHYLELSTLTSSRGLRDAILAAQPPTVTNRQMPDLSLEDLNAERIGSNGWAIGSERTAGGQGMLLANPHFPWEGELKLYESHLTVPGQLDVYGASLMGVVGVLIGFNHDVAWTHTVSDGHKFTLYQLQLDPTNPTAYIYDGKSRAMQRTTYGVNVLQPDGSLKMETRTLYRSHWGPMVMLPPVGWTSTTAITMRDANAYNPAIIEHVMRNIQSTSLEELQRVHDEVSGMPWVNTMAVSKEGKAWYVDSSATPALSADAIARWLELVRTDTLTASLSAQHLTLLPGNSSTFEWQEKAGARSPGLMPVSEAPRLLRDDFIFNANDSHWLSNPLAPLSGFSPMYGFERTPRTPRTRMNARVLLDADNTFSGADHRFDLDELKAAAFSNRGVVAEELRAAVVTRCRTATAPVPYDGLLVDLKATCDALAGWDQRLDVDSSGAVLWREFLGDFPFSAMTNAGALWAEAFDPQSGQSAIATPRGLAPAGVGVDRIHQALAAATVRLRRAGLSPAVRLGAVQGTVRGGVFVPVHGGMSYEGVSNIVSYGTNKSTMAPPLRRGTLLNPLTGLTTDNGYPINFGTSFVMALEFTAAGPRAEALLTYGQVDDPASPHHIDQTQRFSSKNWRAIRYSEADIADGQLAYDRVSAPFLKVVPVAQ